MTTLTTLTTGNNAKSLLLCALLACGLAAGPVLNAGAADAPPAVGDTAEPPAAQPPAPPAAPPCPRMGHVPMNFTGNHTKFLEDTKDLRRRIAVTEGAMKAVMRSSQPDVNLAQRFAGELFDLREQMRAKAAEHGLQPMPGGKMGRPCRSFMGHGAPHAARKAGCGDMGRHGMGHGRRHGMPQGGMDCGCGTR